MVISKHNWCVILWMLLFVSVAFSWGWMGGW